MEPKPVRTPRLVAERERAVTVMPSFHATHDLWLASSPACLHVYPEHAISVYGKRKLAQGSASEELLTPTPLTVAPVAAKHAPSYFFRNGFTSPRLVLAVSGHDCVRVLEMLAQLPLVEGYDSSHVLRYIIQARPIKPFTPPPILPTTRLRDLDRSFLAIRSQ
jgi:hypothetical protein